MTSDIEEVTWVRVMEADKLLPGTDHLFTYQGEDIAIYNIAGEFYAIGDTCTHAEASLTDGDFYEDMRGWVAECPLHGSQFDVTTGNAVSLPATGNTGKYDLKVVDGVIYINPEPVIPRHE
jgi:nitrite reductase/ring-hydroxylating ferredoxin subunit